MYYANCEWYVDMGEYNKPLCERKSLRPAKCSECPVYIGSIEAENAKLRELVRKYSEYTSQDRCEGCFCKSRCNDGDVDECWQLTEIRRMARELGVGEDT